MLVDVMAAAVPAYPSLPLQRATTLLRFVSGIDLGTRIFALTEHASMDRRKNGWAQGADSFVVGYL